MSSELSVRQATHAGSWYLSSAKELSYQLENWLDEVGEKSHRPARAIIAPHAGYRHSGSCAAFAYKQIDPIHVKRAFILGPSHRFRLSGCALSPAQVYHTPLGDLIIDESIYEELHSTHHFEKVSLTVDENEHSIEMHLPYIKKLMGNSQQFTIVPIMVGSLTSEQECLYGEVFSSYLSDPSNLFVISSDFCHWGARFHYQFYEESWGQIHQSIQKLDEIGMDVIEEMSPTGFANYLKKYKNTICGRNPISILLNAISSLQLEKTETKPFLKFLKYAQSSKCLKQSDSSVSYAAAALIFA